MPSIKPYAGKHRAQVYVNGKRESKLFERKSDAVEWAFKREVELGNKNAPKTHTFTEAATRYLETVSTTKKGDAVKREKSRLDHMAGFFGEDTPLVEVTSDAIGRWRDSRLKTVQPSTMIREYKVLRGMLTVARREWKWITDNVTEGVRMPKEEEDVREDYVWGWKDIRKVLRHCQSSQGVKTQQVGIAFHTALRTALRLKEVMLSKLVGNIITITDSKTTLKGKVIKIPTTKQGRKVMGKYAGMAWVINANEASTMFHEVCLQVGIREIYVEGLSFHDSRATALTHMSKRMPVQHLQKISRHRDINLLIRRYYRETAEQISANL